MNMLKVYSSSRSSFLFIAIQFLMEGCVNEERTAVTWFYGSVLSLVKKVLCVFLPFDEDRRSDFAWSQCGRDFVRGVRCDDCDFKERGIHDASHKTWCVVNVVYAFVAVRGSAWKLAYEYETRVYACKR